MTNRIHNFSAGPAVLPVSALEEARESLLALPGVGMSVMEISHRSGPAEEIFKAVDANMRTLLNIPSNYKILFLQGGASMQFSMVPMNLFGGESKAADYLITGSWGAKAVKEAKKEGQPRVAWTGKEEGFNRVPAPSEFTLDPASAFVHFTSNETIEGVEFQNEPDSGSVPLVCDASSNILSKPIPIEKYGLIYAGSQKNMGPAGVTFVIIREDLLERSNADLPSMLSYKVHAENDSLYNTPPVFSVYMVLLVTKWLLNEIGGLEKMEKLNREKAQLLYGAIDASGGFYKGHATGDCRSLMNVTWRLPSEDLEKAFVSEAKKQGLDGVKGHRSVGGIRASIYNACPRASVEALRDFMVEFQKSKG